MDDPEGAKWGFKSFASPVLRLSTKLKTYTLRRHEDTLVQVSYEHNRRGLTRILLFRASLTSNPESGYIAVVNNRLVSFLGVRSHCCRRGSESGRGLQVRFKAMAIATIGNRTARASHYRQAAVHVTVDAHLGL